MAVTFTQGDVQHPSTWANAETFTESTATAFRTLNNDVEVSHLGLGTATAGPVHNLYELVATTTASGREGDAKEGMEKYVVATATGRADLFIELPTTGRLPLGALDQSNPGATGDIVMVSATATWAFQDVGDFMYLKFMNGTWNWFAGIGATQTAAT